MHLVGPLTIRKILSFPFALMLAPLVKRNYRLRAQGLLPDEWYWADMLLLKIGYYVKG